MSIETTNHGPQLLLPANLAAIAKCCSKGDPRFTQTEGVQLERMDNADGSIGYRASATDGRKMAMVEGTSDNPDDYPSIPAIAAAPNGAMKSVVLAKDWQAAFKAVPKRCHKPILKQVAAVMSENVTTLASTDLDRCNVQTPRNVDGRFPPVQQVIPKGNGCFRVKVDPWMLSDLLQTAGAFTSDDSLAVEMTFYGPQKPFKLTHRNHEGQSFTGVIVPLNVKEDDKPLTVKDAPHEFWKQLKDLATAAMSHHVKHDLDALQADVGKLQALCTAVRNGEYVEPIAE